MNFHYLTFGTGHVITILARWAFLSRMCRHQPAVAPLVLADLVGIEFAQGRQIRSGSRCGLSQTTARYIYRDVHLRKAKFSVFREYSNFMAGIGASLGTKNKYLEFF